MYVNVLFGLGSLVVIGTIIMFFNKRRIIDDNDDDYLYGDNSRLGW